MPLEQRATNIWVKSLCELFDPECFLCFFFALIKITVVMFWLDMIESHCKDMLEEIERVLVHGVDVSQVGQYEEQSTNTNTDW